MTYKKKNKSSDGGLITIRYGSKLETIHNCQRRVLGIKKSNLKFIPYICRPFVYNIFEQVKNH